MSERAAQPETRDLPQEEGKKSLWEKLSDRCEQLGKSLVLLAAVLYTLGLIGTNLYLLSIGVSDFSSLRPKYIMTGFWILLMAFLTFLPALGVALATVSRPGSKRTVFINVVICFIGTLLLFYTVNERVKAETNVVIVLVIIQFFATCMILIQLPSGKDVFPGYARFVIIELAFASLIMPPLFARAFYPLIPEALGGGKPMTAQIILGKDGFSFWKQAGLIVQTNTDSGNADSNVSGNVEVLYQSEHEIVIRASYKDGGQRILRTIILNKSLVDGIILVEKK
jgi:hypothetical protein